MRNQVFEKTAMKGFCRLSVSRFDVNGRFGFRPIATPLPIHCMRTGLGAEREGDSSLSQPIKERRDFRWMVIGQVVKF